ncbi:hypothetical protein AB836_02030 [Rickettsiales bacterium (ex Bugula neritina AB1)]|nr:hypothetical protein AB836_02030 [Rickettsiales bacterium (ex Bugula neritina AB1)]
MMRQISFFSELVREYKQFFQKDTIFFFDIEGTILKTNIYHEALYQQKYNDILKSICEKYEENYLYISRYGRFFNRNLTDKSIYTLLHILKKNQSDICILTFAKYSFDREKSLKDKKIYFNNQIWTSGNNKGEFILEFLKRKKNFKKIFFIDDKIEHIENVENIFNIQKKNYELFTFLYKNLNIFEVTKESFISFWTSVIMHYKEKQKRKYNNKKIDFYEQ